jgi:hypothetical protein
MSDAARRFDEEDTNPSFTRPRTAADGALTMHVMVNGHWHRRTPDMGSTACGILYHAQFAPVRREELSQPMCRGCFTAHELALADAKEGK